MSSSNSTSPSDAGLGSFPGIENFVGPPLITSFIQALQTGVIINQAITFIGHTMIKRDFTGRNARQETASSKHSPGPYRSSPTVRIGERGIMKFVAMFALAMAATQTILSFYESWLSLVVNFGNWVAAITLYWPAKLQSVVNSLLAAPVQCFLIWRCWLLTNRNTYILVTFVTFVLATVAVSMNLSIGLFRVDFSKIFTPEMEIEGTHPSVVPVNPMFVASLAIPALLDVCLTTILLSFLLRSRTVVVSRRFRMTLQSIILVTWEAALPPCLCAVASLIVYFSSRSTFWCLLFQAMLGQLYTISLFVTLNGFNDLKNRDRDVDPTTALGYSWSDSSGQVRYRSRIQTNQEHEITMSIEITSSLERDTRSERGTTSPPRTYSPRSPRLRLTFPQVHANHTLDAAKAGGTDTSRTPETSTTHTALYSVADSKYIDCAELGDVAELRESQEDRKSCIASISPTKSV